VKKLKYDGDEGNTNQFGTFEPGWEGEKPDAEADLLLTIPGFSEIKPEVKKKKAEKEGN
jgi:hypothetical protein